MHTWYMACSFGNSSKKDILALEKVLRRAMKIIRIIEQLPYEEKKDWDFSGLGRGDAVTEGWCFIHLSICCPPCGTCCLRVALT